MEGQTTTPVNTQPSGVNTPMAIIIAGAIVAGGLYLGLSNNTAGNTNTAQGINIVTPGQGTATPDQNVAGAQDPVVIEVSYDDDPVQGSDDAPVTMVEFSDYECPYCKRHFADTYPQIKRDYIDTGKLRLVYRDLPLSFHDPMATKEAMAANCAREQGGDTTYFKYHDEIFTRTTSNGTGLTDQDLLTIANDLKLSASKMKTCIDSEKYKDEVQADAAYAQTVGASGTPTFFIGKSGSDSIQGEMIVGAVPYSSMKQIIEQYLN